MIDTTFDPIQQILRPSGFSTIQLILDHSAKARPMIEAATENPMLYQIVRVWLPSTAVQMGFFRIPVEEAWEILT